MEPPSSNENEFLLKSNLSKSISGDLTSMKDLIINSNYLDTSFVNGIRRYAISKINTVAFEYSPTPMIKDYIIFNRNDSNMNNDFIGHRLGLLPLDIIGIKYILLIYKILLNHDNQLNEILNTLLSNKENAENKTKCINNLKTNLKLKNNIDLISKIQFYIEQENNSLDVMNITSEHIQFRFMDFNEKYELEINESILKKYNELFELYEEYNQIENSLINNISHLTLIRNVFKLFNYNDIDYGVLLCKIKKLEKLNCNMYLNIGNGDKHSRWSVVSPCTYSFELDNELILNILQKKCEKNTKNETDKLILTEDYLKTLITDDYPKIESFISNRYQNIISFELNTDLVKSKNDFLNSEIYNSLTEQKQLILSQYLSEKDKLLNTFNKCDKQRYYKGKEAYELYKREFKLLIESTGFYTPEKILFKSFKLLKNDLIHNCEMIIYLLENFTNFPLENEHLNINQSNKIQNGIDILFTNSNHAIGNIFTSYIYHLYNNESNFKYIAYKMVHPLKTEMIITIGLDNIENINADILDIFNTIKNVFENMNILNFV